MPGARDQHRRRRTIGAWIELDAFGNPLIRIELAQPHRELKVVSQMQIEVHARPAVSPETTEPWEKVRDSFAYRGAWPSRDQLDAARFRHESPHVRLKQILHRLLGGMFSGRPADPRLRGSAEHQAARGHHIRARRDHHQHFAHRSGRNAARCLPGLRAPHDFLPAFARTAGALRERLPAHQSPRSGRRREAGRRCALRMPGWRCGVRRTAGSNSIPTNGCFAGTDHIAVAWGRDFGDVSPLRGVILGGADHKLSVTVSGASPSDCADRRAQLFHVDRTHVAHDVLPHRVVAVAAVDELRSASSGVQPCSRMRYIAVMRPVRSAPCWQWMRNGPFSVFFSMRMTSMTCLSSMRQVRIFTRSVRSDVPFTSSSSLLKRAG